MNDFQSILTYVNDNNEFATRRVRKKIDNAFQLLQSSPRLGSLFESTSPGEIRVLTAGRFRIFYTPDDESQPIHILTIRHVKWEDPNFSE